MTSHLSPTRDTYTNIHGTYAERAHKDTDTDRQTDKQDNTHTHTHERARALCECRSFFLLFFPTTF